MRLLSDPAPWWGWSPPSPYSIIDLLASGTISPAGAGLLWWSVEQGASVVIAAGPRGAGKTTLASTLFSFLPDDASVYFTGGPGDPLDVDPTGGPTWLFVNELSDHVPLYLWGETAERAFSHVRNGAHMVASLHATSIHEIGGALHRDAGVPAERAHLFDLGVILSVERTPTGIRRRVTEMGLLNHRAQPAAVCSWDAQSEGIELSVDGTALLAEWGDVKPDLVSSAINERARYLVATGRRGVHTREDVTGAVRHFRRSGGAI